MSLSKQLLLLSLILLGSLPAKSPAVIRFVPDDYQTIQQGIDSVGVGDTVLVAPGIYRENINFGGRNVVVGSWFLTSGDASFIDSTIIDGGRNGSVVRFERGENPQAMLAGFILRNGTGSQNAVRELCGGGIFCRQSTPTLSYLKIVENQARNGAGIYYEGCVGARLERTLIYRNQASASGGGIELRVSSPFVINCTITENEAARGGGIYLQNENRPELSNSILWNNYPQEAAFALGGQGNRPSFAYCNVYNGIDGIFPRGGDIAWNIGNIQLDPQFAAPEAGDFNLTENSPCLDAGNPELSRDIDETWPDIGAFTLLHRRQDVPKLSVECFEFNIGVCEVGETSLKRTWLRNIGYSPLTLQFLRLQGENPQDFILEADSAFTLSPGEGRNLGFIFRPRSGGAKSAQVVFQSNDSLRSRVETSLSGYGFRRNEHHLWRVPQEFNRIQAAVDIAVDGDTVLIDTGFYRENIDFLGKQITVASRYLLQPEPLFIYSTTLAGDGESATVSFTNGESRNVHLTGLTITGLREGINCNGASPTISRCLIVGNGNADIDGGALSCTNNANPLIFNSTLYGNIARRGGGVFCRSARAEMINCILWRNSPENGYFALGANQSRLQITYSDIEGGTQSIRTNNYGVVVAGAGIITAFPLFRDTTICDLRLRWENFPQQDSSRSPCIDAGSPDIPRDPDTTRADIGALFFNQNIYPDIFVAPQEITFTDVPAGETATIEIVILNIGTLDLCVNSQRIETIEGPPFITIGQGSGAFSLASQDSHLTEIVFQPWIEASYSAIFWIESNDPNEGRLGIPITAHTLNALTNISTPPAQFQITNIYPNPFNRNALVCFDVPLAQVVSLSLFDISGRELVLLYRFNAAIGRYIYTLDSRDLTSGLYILRLQGDKRTSVQKILLAH